MPAEEGFPAYLPSRLAEFYERGGRAEVLSGGEGSVTLIGAVSPQGSDFSEPVTQNTKRFTRCFWLLISLLLIQDIILPLTGWTATASILTTLIRGSGKISVRILLNTETE